jgi:hypothetical protein
MANATYVTNCRRSVGGRRDDEARRRPLAARSRVFVPLACAGRNLPPQSARVPLFPAKTRLKVDDEVLAGYMCQPDRVEAAREAAASANALPIPDAASVATV